MYASVCAYERVYAPELCTEVSMCVPVDVYAYVCTFELGMQLSVYVCINTCELYMQVSVFVNVCVHVSYTFKCVMYFYVYVQARMHTCAHERVHVDLERIKLERNEIEL